MSNGTRSQSAAARQKETHGGDDGDSGDGYSSSDDGYGGDDGDDLDEEEQARRESEWQLARKEKYMPSTKARELQATKSAKN
jgi:hypothetical protein